MIYNTILIDNDEKNCVYNIIPLKSLYKDKFDNKLYAKVFVNEYKNSFCDGPFLHVVQETHSKHCCAPFNYTMTSYKYCEFDFSRKSDYVNGFTYNIYNMYKDDISMFDVDPNNYKYVTQKYVDEYGEESFESKSSNIIYFMFKNKPLYTIDYECL